MKRFLDVNGTKDLGLLDGAGKMIYVGEVGGLLEGNLVELTEVATGPLTAIRLVLQMQR